MSPTSEDQSLVLLRRIQACQRTASLLGLTPEEPCQVLIQARQLVLDAGELIRDASDLCEARLRLLDAELG